MRLLISLIALAILLAGAVVALVVQQHRQSTVLAARSDQFAAQHLVSDAPTPTTTTNTPIAPDASAARSAQQQAARRAARLHATRERAAREKAAERRAAARVARQAAARERVAAAAAAAAPHLITGDFTVPDINGALVTQVGGYPGQPLDTFGGGQLKKLETLLNSLAHGTTYPCPLGSGGGFSDIVQGTQVMVQDGSGEIIGSSTLAGGHLNEQGCTFTFRVTVPDTNFYQITVSHRGALTYSREEMLANGWHVSGHL